MDHSTALSMELLFMMTQLKTPQQLTLVTLDMIWWDQPPEPVISLVPGLSLSQLADVSASHCRMSLVIV